MQYNERKEIIIELKRGSTKWCCLGTRVGRKLETVARDIVQSIKEYNVFVSYLFWSTTIFDVQVTVHRVTFLIIKPTRCTNFSNLFLEWMSTCFGHFLCPSSGVFHYTQSNSICHTSLLTACEQDPARKLSAYLYDKYLCCVYSEKLLMMGRGTIPNM